MKELIKKILAQGKMATIGGLVFLSFCPLFIILGKEAIVDIVAALAYALLVVGVVQSFLKYLKEERENAKK